MVKGMKGSRRPAKFQISSNDALPIKKGAKAIVRMTSAMTYLSLCKLLFSFSGRLQWLILSRLRNKVIKSMYSPNGQIQPQKALPKKKVATIITPKRSPFQTAIMDR